MRKHGIDGKFVKRTEAGTFAKSDKFRQDITIEEIVELYINQGKSALECASILNTYPAKIQRMLKKHGYKFRKKSCYNSGKLNPKYTGYEEIQGSYISGLKCRAKDRKIYWNITNKELWDKFIEQERKCAYTGIILTLAKNNEDHKKGNYTASIDRIDSSKGYEKDNVQWVHKRINIMKGNMSEEEFIEWCKLVSEDRVPNFTEENVSHSKRLIGDYHC